MSIIAESIEHQLRRNARRAVSVVSQRRSLSPFGRRRKKLSSVDLRARIASAILGGCESGLHVPSQVLERPTSNDDDRIGGRQMFPAGSCRGSVALKRLPIRPPPVPSAMARLEDLKPGCSVRGDSSWRDRRGHRREVARSEVVELTFRTATGRPDSETRCWSWLARDPR